MKKCVFDWHDYLLKAKAEDMYNLTWFEEYRYNWFEEYLYRR